jgi:hypothetical protein
MRPLPEAVVPVSRFGPLGQLSRFSPAAAGLGPLISVTHSDNSPPAEWLTD